MASYPFRALFASTALIFAAGCASGPIDPSMRPLAAAEEGTAAERGTDGASGTEKRAESSRESVAAEAPRERERSGARREAQVAESRPERGSSAEPSRSSETRPTTSSSSGSNSENTKLIAQLNETSRELAALRAANARLSAERPRASAGTTRETSVKVDPAEEKIAASVRSYAQFKQDLTALMADAEKARSENSALNEKLKDAMARADEARANLARAENDLKKEKVARADAEQAAGKLREQLRAIARAVSGAGLNLDKIADGSAGK